MELLFPVPCTYSLTHRIAYQKLRIHSNVEHKRIELASFNTGEKAAMECTIADMLRESNFVFQVGQHFSTRLKVKPGREVETINRL